MSSPRTELGCVRLTNQNWVVAHVILVSAQVPLVLTLGLWTLGLRTWAWQLGFCGADAVNNWLIRTFCSFLFFCFIRHNIKTFDCVVKFFFCILKLRIPIRTTFFPPLTPQLLLVMICLYSLQVRGGNSVHKRLLINHKIAYRD